MEPQRTTRFAWKALKGLKTLRLTPTIPELPPSIRYTFEKDEMTSKYVQHWIDTSLKNGGVILDPKHTDDISLNLLPPQHKQHQTSSSSSIEDYAKSNNALLQTLLDSKDAKTWNPELRRLLNQVRESTDPVQSFELMSQRMDPQTRALLYGLIQNAVKSQSADPQNRDDTAEEAMFQALRAEREKFLQILEKTQKSTLVLDDLLIKRLDQSHLEQQLRLSHEKRLNELATTNPFDRVEAEYNTLNPIEAYLEASKLFIKLGETDEAVNSDANEAEAIRRLTAVENDFASNFESLYKKQKKGQQLTRVAARYKAMTEVLRSNITQTMDERQVNHLKRYYAELRSLPPMSFVSFDDFLNVVDVQPLVHQVVVSSSSTEALNALRSNLKQQWEAYLQQTAPLRQLNQRFVAEQKAYLSPEQHTIVSLQLERENLLLDLYSADFVGADVSKIVGRINEIDAQGREALFKQVEQGAAGDKSVLDAVQVVRQLVQADMKLRDTPEYKNTLGRFQGANQFTSYFHPEITQQHLSQLDVKIASQLSKEIDAVMSQETFATLSANLKKYIQGLDTTLSQQREQLVKTVHHRRNVNEVYQMLQRYGIKETETQALRIQKAVEAQAVRSVKEDQAIHKQINELIELTTSEIIAKNSIQNGFMSTPVLEKVVSILESSPAVKEQFRSLIVPKRYYDREVQLQKSGRVPLKSKVVKRVTISALPEGFRRKGDKKVVLTARVKDLGLNDVQKKRLIAIAGPKYIKESDTIRLVVRMFETPEEGEVYAKNYLHELVEVAKNDQLEFEAVIEEAQSTPLQRLEKLYADLQGEDEQSAEALSKWIMYKETGKKGVGADLTYGEGVKEVVYGDKESKTLKDKYGYTIQEEDDEEDFFVPEADEDE